MTEKEKMLAGEIYDANYDEQLIAERLAAQDLCHEYNLLKPSDLEGRRALIDRLGIAHGANCIIQQPFICDYGYNISVGDNFFANSNFSVLDGAKVTIGNNVFIAPNVGIYTAGHPLDAAQRNRGLEYARPVTIGNDVWIGAGVHILPGVTIGDGCVIGAGSIVNRDIPPHHLAAGNPARPIRPL